MLFAAAPSELQSELLVSLLMTHIIIRYIIPYTTRFEEFRLQLI